MTMVGTPSPSVDSCDSPHPSIDKYDGCRWLWQPPPAPNVDDHTLPPAQAVTSGAATTSPQLHPYLPCFVADYHHYHHPLHPRRWKQPFRDLQESPRATSSPAIRHCFYSRSAYRRRPAAVDLATVISRARSLLQR